MRSCLKIGVVFFLGSTIIGCAGIKNNAIHKQLHASNCSLQHSYNYKGNELPSPFHLTKIDTLTKSLLSENSLNIAHAIAVLPKISEYIRLKKSPASERSIEQRLHLLELKQQINDKISNASLEISATTAEMDCEEERTSQIANYLKSKESELESKLTVAAIVVGASGALLTSGIVKNDRASNIVGIGTGIAEATLGLIMLFNNRSVEFYHERNALKEIWEGKASSNIFPASVWYFLKYKNPNIPDSKSQRTQLLEKWANFEQIKSKADKTKYTELYFDKGGRYAADELTNRANMYDQLESVISLMKQDLNRLSQEFESLGK